MSYAISSSHKIIFDTECLVCVRHCQCLRPQQARSLSSWAAPPQNCHFWSWPVIHWWPWVLARIFHPTWIFINSWISVFMWSTYLVIWPYDSWTSPGFHISSLSAICVFWPIKMSSFLTPLFSLLVSSWPLSFTYEVRTPFLLLRLSSPIAHNSLAPLSFCSIQQPNSKPGSIP